MHFKHLRYLAFVLGGLCTAAATGALFLYASFDGARLAAELAEDLGRIARDWPLDLPAGLFGWVPAYSGTVDDVLIDARDAPIDGSGKVLGRAGGLLIRQPDWQPYYGIMEFDSADLEDLAASGSLEEGYEACLEEVPARMAGGAHIPPFRGPREEGAKARVASTRLLDLDREEACGRFRSSDGSRVYRTTLESCTCPAFRHHRVPCKHMLRLAAELEGRKASGE